MLLRKRRQTFPVVLQKRKMTVIFSRGDKREGKRKRQMTLVSFEPKPNFAWGVGFFLLVAL